MSIKETYINKNDVRHTARYRGTAKSLSPRLIHSRRSGASASVGEFLPFPVPKDLMQISFAAAKVSKPKPYPNEKLL